MKKELKDIEVGKYYHWKKIGIIEIFEVTELRENGFMGYDIWCSISYYRSGSKDDPWYCENVGDNFYEITKETFPEYFI